MKEKPNNQYFITYSNSFYFEGELLAFRKKKLFNISSVPKLILYNNTSNCWIIKRKHLSLLKSKSLVTDNKVIVDVSDLQWYKQIDIDLVINL